jgi:hypothetical protein
LPAAPAFASPEGSVAPGDALAIVPLLAAAGDAPAPAGREVSAAPGLAFAGATAGVSEGVSPPQAASHACTNKSAATNWIFVSRM